MMRNRLLLISFFVFAAGGECFADERRPGAQVEAVLKLVLSEPKAGFHGHAITILWIGDRTRSHEFNIAFRPPGRYRREYLSPDGSVATLAISDGAREWLHHIPKGKKLIGDAVKSAAKLLSPAQEESLLRENYVFQLKGSERAAGRDCWVLELIPKREDRSRQTMTVDKATGVVLANRRYLPKGRLAALSKFTKFEPETPPEDKFIAPGGTVTAKDHQIAPDFMTVAELDHALGEPSDFPKGLPGGFVFESADFFQVRGEIVKHARYTDGLAVISLFQTRKPVRMPAQETVDDTASADPSFHLTVAGHVLRVKARGRHLTIIGDSSVSLLGLVAASLQNSSN